VLASGAYARAVGINKEGLKRHGFDAQRIRDIYRAFKTVLRGSDLKADLHTLEEACVGQADVQQFIDFIRASERGVVR
jgi:UDP-N-acetylglucosamine acyltransferase